MFMFTVQSYLLLYAFSLTKLLANKFHHNTSIMILYCGVKLFDVQKKRGGGGGGGGGGFLAMSGQQRVLSKHDTLFQSFKKNSSASQDN